MRSKALACVHHNLKRGSLDYFFWLLGSWWIHPKPLQVWDGLQVYRTDDDTLELQENGKPIKINITDGNSRIGKKAAEARYLFKIGDSSGEHSQALGFFNNAVVRGRITFYRPWQFCTFLRAVDDISVVGKGRIKVTTPTNRARRFRAG